MGRNFKYLIILFSLTVLYSTYYFGIPAIVNLPERASFIEQTVFKETGYKIKITNPSLKMGLIPSVWLKADKFDILNNDNSSAFCIENPYINIRLLPLILKDLDIKYFSANNATINLLFDKDSKLKLGQYLLDTQIKSPLKLKHASIDIDGYNINLEDKVQNKKIFLNGKYLTVNNFTADKHVNFSTIANLTTGKKKASLNADIDLKLPINKISDDQLDISANIVNLDLSDFSIYAKALSKNKIKSISGLINFTAKTNIKPDNHKQIKTNLYINDIGIFKDDITTSI